MDAHAHDVKKEVRGYLVVFASLSALTVVTVAVKYLHLQVTEAICVALAIATFKGALVVCYFMHLISERKLIYTILIFTVFFFAAMVVLFISGHHGIQNGAQFVS